MELRLGEPVEHDGDRDAHGERDRDRKDLSVEGFHDPLVRASRLELPRQDEILDRTLRHEVGGHGEEPAERGTLEHDLGDFQCRKRGEMVHLQRPEGVAQGAGAEYQPEDQEWIAGEPAAGAGVAFRQPADDPAKAKPGDEDGSGPPDDRHLPGVAEPDPVELLFVDQPPQPRKLDAHHPPAEHGGEPQLHGEASGDHGCRGQRVVGPREGPRQGGGQQGRGWARSLGRGTV